jgi:hypothetical protein
MMQIKEMEKRLEELQELRYQLSKTYTPSDKPALMELAAEYEKLELMIETSKSSPNLRLVK